MRRTDKEAAPDILRAYDFDIGDFQTVKMTAMGHEETFSRGLFEVCFTLS